MSAQQRAVATLLGLVDEAMEANTLHDALGTWRALAEIKVVAESLSISLTGQGTFDGADL